MAPRHPGTTHEGPPRPQNSDPDRPVRIAEAAIRVIQRNGVERLTHRAVATEAGVPLGSTTYYFATLDDILAAALERAKDRNAEVLRAWADGLPGEPDVPRSLTELVLTQATEVRGTTVLEYELYLAALRRPMLRPLALEWSAVMTTVLERFVDPETADALSALYDGLLMRVLQSDRDLRPESVDQIFRRVAGG